jgi:repressor LexA
MYNLKDLLAEYKRQTHQTNDYIAEQCGVNKSTVSRWCRGHTKKISSATLEKLAALLQLDPDDLSSFSGMQLEKPILGTVKAGYGLFAEQNLDGYVNVSQEDYNNGDYFLRVSGDSMIGEKIHDQDLLYVKAMDDVPSGTIAVVLIGGDEVSVKKLIKKKDYWILQAANPNVEPRIFTLQEVEETPVRVIGKVLYARSEIA